MLIVLIVFSRIRFIEVVLVLVGAVLVEALVVVVANAEFGKPQIIG